MHQVAKGHLPKVVYTPFKWGCLEYLPPSTVGRWEASYICYDKLRGHVMKNWLPLVFGPVFTIDKQPEKCKLAKRCIENNFFGRVKKSTWRTENKTAKEFEIPNVELYGQLIYHVISIYSIIFLSLKEPQTSSLMLQGRHELILQIHAAAFFRTLNTHPNRMVEKESHVNSQVTWMATGILNMYDVFN